MKLQSVDLRVPDVEATARFFAQVWGLERVQGNRLRGTVSLPYLVGLDQGAPAIRAITFCGADAEREVKGLEGETYRFVREQRVSRLPAGRDRPIRLAHVVLNSADVDATERFATSQLGFKVSDRTRHMTFMR